MFRRIVLLTSLMTCTMAGQVSAEGLFNYPETVVWDSVGSRYFVSSMIGGDIIQIDEYGGQSVFARVPSKTYGMTIADNKLFIGCDSGALFGIVGYDLTLGEMVFHRVPPGMWGVNGMAADTSGNIYFCDTGHSRVTKIRLSDGASSLFANIDIPNAICFDPLHNRLLVTSNTWWVPVYAVDLADSSVSTVTTVTGQFSGLALDQLNRLYVAFFGYDQVLQLDSTLVGSPLYTFSTLLNGPEGICFNRQHSKLCIPNLLDHRVDFIDLDVDVWMTNDTVFGWAGFSTQFAGFSAFDVSDWFWDFGDGGSAETASPVHFYDSPGFFDVTVTAVTVQGDTLRRIYPNHIASLADTLRADDVAVEPGQPIVVPIVAANHVPLDRMYIPVKWSGGLDLVLDSISVAGCRTQAFQDVTVINYSANSKSLYVRLRSRTDGVPSFLEPGSGPVLRVWFHQNGTAAGSPTVVAVDGYPPSSSPRFESSAGVYQPVVVSGNVGRASCCLPPTVGDVDQSGTVDITDISVFIDNQFLTLTPLVCDAEGDVDFSGVVDVTDVSIVIDNQFITLTPLSPCP